MTKEQLEKIWAGSALPKDIQQRITGEVDQIMFNDTPKAVRSDATRVYNILTDLRYMSIISPHEHYRLVDYMNGIIEERLQQLEGTDRV